VQNDHQVHHHLHRMPGAIASFSSRTWAQIIAPAPKTAPGGPVDPGGAVRSPIHQSQSISRVACAVAYERYVGQNKPGAKQAVLFTYGTVSWMQLDIRATPAAKNGCCIALLLLLLGDFHPRTHTHGVLFISWRCSLITVCDFEPSRPIC